MGRKHVFGKVVKGLDILKKIEQVVTTEGKPGWPVKIIDCGKTSESETQGAAGKEKGNVGCLGLIERILWPSFDFINQCIGLSFNMYCFMI